MSVSYAQKFTEKAITGGWKPEWTKIDGLTDLAKESIERQAIELYNLSDGDMSWLLLKPAAWRAVGQVEGWDTHIDWAKLVSPAFVFDKTEVEGWKFYMHRMIDALTEGKDVESFLASILKS